MNTTKIKNVDRDICYLEQLVAYNLSYSYSGIYRICNGRNDKNSFAKIINLIDGELKRIERKINKNLVLILIERNFINFINCGSPLLLTHKQVGDMFKLNAENGKQY